MKQNKKNETPEGTVVNDIILQAGKLNYSVDKVVSVVRSKLKDIDTDQLFKQLTTKGTPEYEAYHAGLEARNYDIEAGMFKAAADGDADAQKSFQSILKERAVNDAVREKFFPEDDDTGDE